MQFADLLETVADLPVFRASLLLAGDRDPSDVRRQLSRWTAAGKLIQLRRGVYVLAKPWRRVEPHRFFVANELHRPSYVSLQSALAYHGLIPESVPVTTSITSGRPVTLDTELGRFDFRHVKEEAFFGYGRTGVWKDQTALVATPAKALLDLVYLTPGGDSARHLESLRLQGLGTMDEEEFLDVARRWDKPKLHRAVAEILELRRKE